MVIVVGDDNQRAGILSALEHNGNTKEVREVLSAVAAMRLFYIEKSKPDLIITPWRLEAGIDGFELLQALRQRGFDVPVCLVVVDLDEERRALVAAQTNAIIVDWKHLEHALPPLLTPKPSV